MTNEKSGFSVNKSNSYDLIVIGDGIAARCLLMEMAKKYDFLNKKILQISSEEHMPACTFRTTSVVSDGIFSEGISPLGDELFHSLRAFKNFYSENNEIAEEVKQFYIFDDSMDLAKVDLYKQRYGEKFEFFFNSPGVFKNSYLVYPEILMRTLEQRSKQLNVVKKFDVVLKVEKNYIKTRQGEFCGEKIILCTGAYTSFLGEQLHQRSYGKSVSGSYYYSDNVEMNESFVLSLGHYNLIYRKETKELLFGGTSYEGYVHAHNIHDLKTNLERLISKTDLNLSLINFVEITGLRHKGQRRRPFSLEIKDDVYLFCGFYKNGFTFPFHMAKQLIDIL